MRLEGSDILHECQNLRQTTYPDGLPTGQAAITGAGRLHAQFVIHTVGPIKDAEGKRAADLLTACYRNVLALATKYDVNSIAFPAISTGIFGYPRDDAAVIASRTIEHHIVNEPSIKDIRLVFFTDQDAKIFFRHQAFSQG